MPSPVGRSRPWTACGPSVQLLGDPQSAYPAVHITGHQRQGIDGGHGHRPAGRPGAVRRHLHQPQSRRRVNERIARNGEPIDDDAFVEVLDSLARLEPMMDDRPTRFELLTAAALAWFADEAVDVAVIEVGLGGRWDCTNVVDGDVGRAHQRQLRPHRGARPHPRGHRP